MASVRNSISNVFQSIQSQANISEKVLNEEFNLAGVTFRGAQNLLRKVDSRWQASLVREKENAYDPNAVAVHVRKDSFDTWKHVGYIPKKMCQSVAKLLDTNQDITITIKRVIGGDENNYGIIVTLSRGN